MARDEKQAWQRLKERMKADPSLRARANQQARDYRRRVVGSPAGWAMARLRQLRYRCQREQIPFDLTAEDLVAPVLCPVLGKPLVLGAGRSSQYRPTVDRIHPDRGYVKDNVRVISWKANRIKSDCTDPAELRAIADYLEQEQ